MKRIYENIDLVLKLNLYSHIRLTNLFSYSLHSFPKTTDDCNGPLYRCTNTTAPDGCIRKGRLCNGRPDCPDGEDEDIEVCRTYCDGRGRYKKNILKSFVSEGFKSIDNYLTMIELTYNNCQLNNCQLN